MCQFGFFADVVKCWLSWASKSGKDHLTRENNIEKRAPETSPRSHLEIFSTQPKIFLHKEYGINPNHGGPPLVALAAITNSQVAKAEKKNEKKLSTPLLVAH